MYNRAIELINMQLIRAYRLVYYNFNVMSSPFMVNGKGKAGL